MDITTKEMAQMTWQEIEQCIKEGYGIILLLALPSSTARWRFPFPLMQFAPGSITGCSREYENAGCPTIQWLPVPAFEWRGATFRHYQFKRAYVNLRN